VDLSAIKYYWFATGEVAGVRATLSRTGYTGEDGFELFVPPAQAERVWNAVLEAGKPSGLIPCGLGARDTLRLEAGMRLYGNDIDETTSVLEADLGWIVGWNKDDFLGARSCAGRRMKASRAG
jgi:aminomethyltransferase